VPPSSPSAVPRRRRDCPCHATIAAAVRPRFASRRSLSESPRRPTPPSVVPTSRAHAALLPPPTGCRALPAPAATAAPPAPVSRDRPPPAADPLCGLNRDPRYSAELRLRQPPLPPPHRKEPTSQRRERRRF